MDFNLRGKVQKKSENDVIVTDEVELKSLPKMSELNAEVAHILNRCTWWDLYGVDWAVFGCAVILVFVALYLMSLPHPLALTLGIFIYGCCHQTFGVKGAHSAVHGTVCKSPKWNKFWSTIFGDVCSSFSGELGYEAHIKCHHPHTNIVGLGDSSVWKMPFLTVYVYMYIAPIALPLITVPVAVSELWGQWKKVINFLILVSIGLAVNFYFLTQISGFSIGSAILVTWISRAMLSIPYIHVNIFQHIGLPMYSNENRPKRIYQMSTGVLNLPRNPILDYCFGHAIVSCHVEHHLFPHLSDNMCLKIKPTVSRFLKKSVLPYNEDSYLSRMMHFTKKYDELMVNAPPITHFIGIQ